MAKVEDLTTEQLKQLNDWARWQLAKTALRKKWLPRAGVSMSVALATSWAISRLRIFPPGHWFDVVGLTLGILGAWMLAGSVLLPRWRIDAMSTLEAQWKEYVTRKGHQGPTSDELARYAYAWSYQVSRDQQEDAVRNWVEGFAGMVAILVGFLFQLVGLLLD